MDAIGLRDAEGLKHVIRHSTQLKLVCHGHIHQEFAGSLDGVPVRSAPSAAIQFRPQTRELQIDDLPPGYRLILLQEDGTFSTEVVRTG